ncbi:MAG: hypothetical protein SGJ13_10785, partial [Actinomycetota bacterium]|nr:hypothetical protein [Actinomycetota bacterium]
MLAATAALGLVALALPVLPAATLERLATLLVGRAQAFVLVALAVGVAVTAAVWERTRLRRSVGIVAVGVCLVGGALTGAFASFTATTSSAYPVNVVVPSSNTPNFTGGYDDISVALGTAVTPQTPTVADGDPPLVYSANPALLGGLSLNPSTGEITGTAGGVVDRVIAGTDRTCVLTVTGVVKCFGLNSSGQLGLGDMDDRGDGAGEMGASLPAVSLGTGRTAVQISTVAHHTCAVLDNATVKCWGINQSGGLGLGDTNDRGDGGGEMGDSLPAVSLGTGRTATAVSAGALHTCALLDNATVKCWGENEHGQLGLGDTADRGDAGGEMGDSLPAVSLGTGRTAVAIQAGGEHTCALLDNATVKCWGYNNFGQLGQGDTADRGDAGGEMGDSLGAVSLGTGRSAVAISGSGWHVCAVLDNATLKCWGYNDFGQLGLGDIDDRGDAGGEMGDSLAAVSLGTGRTAVAVSTHAFHTCAVLDNATVKCWGFNSQGQLGLGDIDDRGDAGGEMGDALSAVSLGTGRTALSVVAGVSHTCAVLDNRAVKCWGVHQSGSLGLGVSNGRGESANEMGDFLPSPALGTFTRTTTVTVTDADLETDTDALDVTIVSGAGSISVPTFTAGYSAINAYVAETITPQTPTVTGGAVPLVYSVNPALLGGLALNSSTGQVSGTAGGTVAQVAAGGNFGCARFQDGSVKCWG